MIYVPDTISSQPGNIHGNPRAPDYSENPTKQAYVKTIENQIDQLVYELYDLIPKEIQIVEGFNEGELKLMKIQMIDSDGMQGHDRI